MAFVNYNNKEITVKIVYYGPALSGKTSCLRYIYTSKSLEKKGKLITLDTDGDRTLFFDFLPIELGKIGDYSVKIQLYTVPGQVAYDTTRKLVLQGADGIIYVADSQVIMKEQNLQSYNNLMKNMKLNNLADKNIPIVLHYNKRDLGDVLSVDELNASLNADNKPFFLTVATNGKNVIEGLQAIMKMVIVNLKNKLTVFQKDKTVMFSKDDVTAATAPELDATISEPNMKKSIEKEMTDTDVVFELDDPYEGHVVDNNDDEIFSLDDVDIISEVNVSKTSPPEVVLKEEDLSEKKNITKPSKKIEKNKEISVDKELVAEFGKGEISIPINITIPDSKDSLKINLNLNLILKK